MNSINPLHYHNRMSLPHSYEIPTATQQLQYIHTAHLYTNVTCLSILMVSSCIVDGPRIINNMLVHLWLLFTSPLLNPSEIKCKPVFMKECFIIKQLMEMLWMWECVCISVHLWVHVLKWQVGISPVSAPWEFSPVGSIKNHVAVTYAYQPGSVVLLTLSDLWAPHLHCLQWTMWSHLHSCHLIARLCFFYHSTWQTVHSFPNNFLSKTSIVLYTSLITGAQCQLETFNHSENTLALHVCLCLRGKGVLWIVQMLP